VASGGRPCAVAWSGGKDSMLALDRARRAGLDVRCALNIYNGESGRVQFHGVSCELVREQIRRLALEAVQLPTGEHDFEETFLRGLDALRARGVGAIIFGNIHLADVRAWYEERTTARGFAHIEPLWHSAPAELLGELLERGHRTRIVSIDMERGREEWLGRVIDQPLAAELLGETERDPLGESGEYHSFVFDGPLFPSPIELRLGARWEFRGHALLEVRSPQATTR
jgi:uncharacterized protein (TIGR00290 family)